jgi:hypothetical protein
MGLPLRLLTLSTFLLLFHIHSPAPDPFLVMIINPSYHSAYVEEADSCYLIEYAYILKSQPTQVEVITIRISILYLLVSHSNERFVLIRFSTSP